MTVDEDDLAGAYADAWYGANIDGFGDEGAGYDSVKAVREFLNSEEFQTWLARETRAREKEAWNKGYQHGYPTGFAEAHGAEIEYEAPNPFTSVDDPRDKMVPQVYQAEDGSYMMWMENPDGSMGWTKVEALHAH